MVVGGDEMSPQRVAKRATFAATIFDILAWVVLVVGVVGAVVAFFSAYSVADGFDAFLLGAAWAIGALVYTALAWAGATLGTVVAGYIANRSEGETGGTT